MKSRIQLYLFFMFFIFIFIVLMKLFHIYEIINNEDQAKLVDNQNEVVIKEPEKIIQTKKVTYSEREIDESKEFVHHYRYIKKELNKFILKCVRDSTEITKDQVLKNCEERAYKQYKMSNNQENIKKLNDDYIKHLNILKSSK